MSTLLAQAVQIAGSLLVLVAFIAAQRGALSTGSTSYLTLNVAGSGVLAAEAVLETQWGFLLLEGTWSVVSALGLVRAVLRRNSARRDQNSTVDTTAASTIPNRS